MFGRFSLARVTGIAALGLGLASLCVAPAAPAEKQGVKFSKRCLMVSPNEGCAVGDVNRDGKPDVVAGTHWFAGPDFVPRPLRDIPPVWTEFYANNGDHLYDVNGDGWLDVISSGWRRLEIDWYKNPGKEGLARGYKWEAHVLKKTGRDSEAFELRDLDGDGVPELYDNCAFKEQPVMAWKFARTADGKPTLEPIVLGREGGGHGWAFGDVNADGREDILVEAGWYERPAGNPFAKPWKFRTETALPHPSCPFLVVDLNGDGRNDLIWGRAHDFGLSWWEQGPPKPDGSTTWSEHLIDKSWSQAHCLAWADLDGDGECELITGKRVRAHGDGDPGARDPECLFYYTLDKKTLRFTRRVISDFGGGVGTGMQICVADMNGDGRPDVVVAGKTGTWLLVNEGLKK
jgi:hypothetical protein